MQYSIYRRTDRWHKLEVLRNDDELFKALAAYQARLKEGDIYNNIILDSIYLGCGEGEYAILNEFDRYVDPRVYYVNIVNHRNEYVYSKWGTSTSIHEKREGCNAFRNGPVAGIHARRKTNRSKSYGFKHLLREVTHEDFVQYNRDTRRIDIHTMGGGYYCERGDKSSYGDRCWKRRKIKRQYMKHR